MKFDYRYIMLDTKRMIVSHRHFFHETDEQAIKDIPYIEDGTEFKCVEIEKSLNEAECKEGNDYFKSIWSNME